MYHAVDTLPYLDHSLYPTSVDSSFLFADLSLKFQAPVTYYAPYCATARRPGVQMMSIVLLRPFVIATERSTDRPCAIDMFDTTRSFKHMSNTCVIRRLALLNLGFIDQLSCTRSLPPSTTSHQRILVCPRT